MAMKKGNKKSKMRVVMVPPVFGPEGQDYMTAQRGIQVPPIRDSIPGLSEARKEKKKHKVAEFLRSLYRD